MYLLGTEGFIDHFVNNSKVIGDANHANESPEREAAARRGAAVEACLF